MQKNPLIFLSNNCKERLHLKKVVFFYYLLNYTISEIICNIKFLSFRCFKTLLKKIQTILLCFQMAWNTYSYCLVIALNMTHWLWFIGFSNWFCWFFCVFQFTYKIILFINEIQILRQPFWTHKKIETPIRSFRQLQIDRNSHSITHTYTWTLIHIVVRILLGIINNWKCV